MRTSESFKNVAAALIEAKTKFVAAKKSGYNTHLKSHYSNLTDIIEAIEPALNDNGLMVMQSNLDTSTEKVMHIETLVLHSSGEWLAFQYNMPIVKVDPQAYGSTTSYGRRYALCAALGITQTDDDAEIAKRKASEFPALIDAAKDMDELRIIHETAKKSLTAAEWKVVEPKLIARRAAFTQATARGFKPAVTEKDAQKKQVEPDNKKPVESENIENFS